MKRSIPILSALFTILSLTTSLSAHAGGREGHGGVFFDCPNKLQLVDAWEAEDANYPMQLGSTNDSLESLGNTYIQRMQFFDPSRAERAKKFFDSVVNDLAELNRNPLSTRTEILRFTDGDLVPSLDSDEIAQPPECVKKQAVTQKKGLGLGEKLLTISRKLYNDPRLTNEMRVLTFFHEFHVGDAVEKGFDHSTLPARMINRVFASPLLASETTVCGYIVQIDALGMMVEKAFRNKSPFLDKSDRYGMTLSDSDTKIWIDPVDGFTCWNSTGRLKSASGIRLNFPLVNQTQTDLMGDVVRFSEDAFAWTSVESGLKFNIESATPDFKKGTTLIDGEILPTAYGYIWKDVRATKYKWSGKTRELGVYDLNFDTRTNKITVQRH